MGPLPIGEAVRVSAPSATPSPAATLKRFQLGVLLVHGIGTQASGETVVHWGDALIRAIRRATGDAVVPTIEWAGHLGGAREEIAAIVRMGDDESAPRWLLHDGWWANAFLAPSYRELVSWGLRALPWFVAMNVAQSYWHAGSQKRWNKILALSRSLTELLVLLALTPLLLLVLALMLLLGLLPIPQLRGFIVRVQSMLTATVGDSMAFVESPVRAGFIRTRLLDYLEQQKRLCERTVVVAHSQGAAAMLDALGAMREATSDGKGWKVLNVPPGELVPDTLITFGAGTNQLVSQRALSAGVLKRFGMNPAVYAMGALLALAIVVTLAYLDLRSGASTLQGFVESIGVYVAGVLGASALVWLANRGIEALAKGSETIRRRKQAITVASAIGIFVGALVLWVVYGKSNDYPLGSVSFGAMALLILAGSLYMILSRDMNTVIAGWVAKPPGLKCWIDLYASADRIPNGPTYTADAGVPASERIWNQDSFLTDHSTYWENLDAFVLRIAKACAETAGSPWIGRLPADFAGIDARAAWRVAFLRLSRWISAIAWIFLGSMVWFEFFDRIWLWELLSVWLPASLTRLTVLVVAIALCAWATNGLITALWRIWVDHEHDAILAGRVPGDSVPLPLLGMGAVLWLLLMAAFEIRFSGFPSVEALLVDPKDWIMAPVMALSFAFVSYLVLTKLMKPPQVYSPTGLAIAA